MRARPGRRSVEERQQAVLEAMAGKATVDQIARRLGVHASTVEGWRQNALAGVEQALRHAAGRTTSELELLHTRRIKPTKTEETRSVPVHLGGNCHAKLMA